MRKARLWIGTVALLVAAVGAVPAQAGDSNGNFQVKLGVTGVLTDDNTNSLIAGVNDITASDWATTNNTVIPSLMLTYYLNKNWAVELFCCFDKVKVDAHGPTIGGLGQIASTWIFPPILTLQYHFDGFGPFKPYLGAGAEWIHYFNSKSQIPGDTVSFNDSFGFALQGGVDYDLGGGWSLGLDVKKVWEDTKITWTGSFAANPVVAKHDLDPLFVTANLGYRFNLDDLLGRRTAYVPLK
jgi:outer membrane protein